MRSAALAAAAIILAFACEAVAQGGRLGNNTGGGGARSSSGSSMGFNRAGTASSGGFSYGDLPNAPAPTVVTPSSTPAGQPCNVVPVSVDGTDYYRCGGSWYAPGLTATGIAYVAVPAPRGH
jgi:hypothetical protein